MLKEINVRENANDSDLYDPYQLLRKDILSYPLLDPEEEKSLFREYVFGKKCKKEFNESLGQNLGNEELLLEFIQKGIDVREKLINSNLRLVLGKAYSYSGTDEKNNKIKDDVIHNFFSGCEGLIKAVEKFDPERGNRFSTYAYPKITKAITENLRWNNIYAPRWVRELTLKYIITMKNYQIVNGKEPSDEYILEKMNTTQERLDKIRDAYTANIGVPLDKKDNNEEEQSGQILSDSFYPNFYEDYYGLYRPTESGALDEVSLNELDIKIYETLKNTLTTDVKMKIFTHMIILGEGNLSKIARACKVKRKDVSAERGRWLKILKNNKEFVSFCIDYLGLRDNRDVNDGNPLD